MDAVDNRKGDTVMTNQELILISGGGWLTATFLNAASRALTTIMDFGRSVGTSIRMIVSGKRC